MVITSASSVACPQHQLYPDLAFKVFAPSLNAAAEAFSAAGPHHGG
jgi:hypothetical protein